MTRREGLVLMLVAFFAGVAVTLRTTPCGPGSHVAPPVRVHEPTQWAAVVETEAARQHGRWAADQQATWEAHVATVDAGGLP